MYNGTRICLAGLLAGALAAGSPAVAAAGFGVSLWEAGTCETSTCTYASVEKDHKEAFTQAAGHPEFGITTFELKHTKGFLPEEEEPEGAPLKRVRVDVPPGLAADPQALEQCSKAQFESKEGCPESTRVGTNKLRVFAALLKKNLSVEAPVYDLEQPQGPEGVPLLFGIHVEALGGAVNEHVFLEGHVAWFSDYHEYFEINNIEQENPVLSSKLIFFGRAGQGNFITLPTACSSTTTSLLELESGAKDVVHAETNTPLGVEHCEEVPFEPIAEVKPQTAQSDQPDGASTEVKVPQYVGPTQINTADIKDATVTLPEGLTLNPSAAHELGTCSPEQIAIGSTQPVSCPESSKIGTVVIETDLPPHSLAGNVYLGNPGGGPITGPPYTIYLDAESVYGVSVRLQGLVQSNLATGRLEATFTENPQLPFSDLILTLNGGARAPLANPLVCGTTSVDALFAPYTGLASWQSSAPFTTEGCPSPLPFSLAQSATSEPAVAAAHTSYTFKLAREDGQQYLAQVATALPEGLLGLIPSVELCPEPQVSQGACSANSRIGTATITAGAGAEPYSFSGAVFLTGPYAGGPFGLSIAVPAVAGPFDLGTVVARAGIYVDPRSARVSVSGGVPTIVKGVPVRLRTLTVAVNRPNFLVDPTSCGSLSTDTTLTSTLGATQSLSSPFSVSGCGALPFSPVFAASTSAKATKAGGASLHTTIAQAPGQANIRSVFVQLPTQLSTRLTTLQQACPEASFAAGPAGCPAGSNVGTATAVTPVLPGRMTGPAYLVSHGGAAFPDLDIVLEGSGVRVILVGNTTIRNGLTSTSFAALPDVPVSSFSLDLPTGPHSALAANTDLCARPLLMPTTITGQNGARVSKTTTVAVAGCANSARKAKVRIVRRKIVRHTLVLTVQTSSGGRLTARGKYLKTVSRRVRAAGRTTLKARLSRRALRGLAHRHRLKVRVRVAFVATPSSSGRASAATAVTFKH